MNGIEYGQKYAAYEAAMKRNNNFGMTDKEQIRAQYERQGKAIQDAQIKAENKILGRGIAKEKAAQRRAAQQAGGDLSQALAGKTPTATTVPPTVQMPAERISLEGFNTKRNKRLQKKLYKQEQKALGAAGTAAETAKPLSNRFSIDGTYWLQDADGRYHSFTNKKDYLKEMRRLTKEGVKFDPNAKVPEGFNPANPNNLPGVNPVKPGPTNGPTNGPVGPNGPTNGPVGPNGPTNGPVGPNGPTNGPVGPNGPTNGPVGPNGPTPPNGPKPPKKGFFGRLGDGLKNIGKKIGNFFKSKGGKATLIGLGIAALVGGAAWLFNKLSGKKSEDAAPVKPNPTHVPGKEDPEKPVEPGKENPEKPVAPGKEEPETPVVPVPGKEDPEKPVEPGKEEPEKPVAPVEPGKEEPENPVNVVPKDYEVKPGDCVWNIAKQHLKDLSNDPNYKPTNAEILKHTNELIQLNQLHYEPDGKVVLIYPKQQLKLSA